MSNKLIYTNTGPIDCTTKLDLSKLRGKSAIVTGGALGLGRAHVRALTRAGVFVTIGDVNEEAGRKLAAETPGLAQFCPCDVTSWADQLRMFKMAISQSPNKGIDIVVANAGISVADSMYKRNRTADPEEPNFSILKTNLIGVMYTSQLALHYFRVQPIEESRDRCLVLGGSVTAYIDLPGSAQYQAAKYGMRGIMRSMRSTVAGEGIRVNMIAPWYVKTQMMGDVVWKILEKKGAKFVNEDDAAQAVLRIVSDRAINGRTFAVLPREDLATGYQDLDCDDVAEDHWLSYYERGGLGESPFGMSSSGTANHASSPTRSKPSKL